MHRVRCVERDAAAFVDTSVYPSLRSRNGEGCLMETDKSTDSQARTDDPQSDVTEVTEQEQQPTAVDDSDQEKGIYLSDVPFNEPKDSAATGAGAGQQDQQPKPEKPEKPLPPTTRFMLVVTFFATLGGFLVGYDIGIVSGSMLYVRPYFRLTTLWTEAIVSGAVGAAAISSLSGGWIIDTIGRRYSMMIGSVIFTAGGVVMGAAPTKELLLIGRITCGLGIGLASVVVPVYVAEASPVHVRGRLTIMWQMMVNLGILLSSLIAAGFSFLPDIGWRYMLGFSAVPGAVQFVGFLFMPESPRWLVDRGRLQEAERVLVRIRGYSDVTDELKDIEKSVEEAKTMSSKGCYILVSIVKTPPVRRALIVGVGLLFFQQWCGINTAIYYSGTVLKMAGFPVKAAVWLVVLPNALLFVAGLIGIYIVDRIGRRPLLLWSMVDICLEQCRGVLAGLTSVPSQWHDSHAIHNRSPMQSYIVVPLPGVHKDLLRVDTRHPAREDTALLLSYVGGVHKCLF